ncbi:MAG: hypothetical protein IKO90_06245 [Bacteroidales bacterium]|nr:hypothetical protein [Bacteroidales bacterium]
MKHSISSRNDNGSPSQMSVKKIFERNVKNSRLGGVGLCVGAILESLVE